MKKALLIYNPNSGTTYNLLQNLDKLTEKLLLNGIALTLYRLDYKYDKLMHYVQTWEFDMLIVSGGDGTLSTIFGELHKNKVNFEKVAVFPTGTSNDLARILDLGNTIDEWIENIVSDKVSYVDYGIINDEYVFLSSFAIGMFSKISYDTDKNLKRNLGKMAYYISAIGELSNLDKFKINLEIDGKKIKKNINILLVLNGESVAGFKKIVHNADISDGLMNIILVTIENHFEIPLLIKDLFTGDFEKNNNVETHLAKECRIEKIKENITSSIDGEEFKHNHNDIDIKFMTNSLKIYNRNGR